MPYIENQQQASFFLISKLVEISEYDKDDLSGMSLAEVEELLNEERYSLSNSFEYRGMSIHIREATFVAIVRPLLKRKWVVGHIDTFSVSDEYGDAIMEAFVDGVEVGKKYPEVPAIELAHETSLDFLIRDKEALREYLKTIPVVKGVPKEKKEILYRVEFGRERVVKVNGKALSRVNFDGHPHRIFDYIYSHPNEDIRSTDIIIEGKPVKRSLRKVVENLGFKGDLKKIFFPDTSHGSIRFVNPVSKNDIPEELHAIDVSILVAQIRKDRLKKKKKG